MLRLSALRRLVAGGPTPSPKRGPSPPAQQTPVPDVLVSFGNQADKITFVSHPGVMAVSKLLEMGHVAQHRAMLTQADIYAISEYDSDLARKAQIAVDEGLAVNFQDLEFFDRPDFVAAFRKEQQILAEARQEVLAAPKGHYFIPKAVKEYEQPMAPKSWRPEMTVSPEILEADPGLRMREELSGLVRQHLSMGPEPVQQIPQNPPKA